MSAFIHTRTHTHTGAQAERHLQLTHMLNNISACVWCFTVDVWMLKNHVITDLLICCCFNSDFNSNKLFPEISAPSNNLPQRLITCHGASSFAKLPCLCHSFLFIPWKILASARWIGTKCYIDIYCFQRINPTLEIPWVFTWIIGSNFHCCDKYNTVKGWVA